MFLYTSPTSPIFQSNYTISITYTITYPTSNYTISTTYTITYLYHLPFNCLSPTRPN